MPGSNCTTQSLPRTTYSSVDKEANVDIALDWIRNNDSTLRGDLDDFVVHALANLAGIATSTGKLTLDQKQKVARESLSWIRQNNDKPLQLDDATIAALIRLPGIPDLGCWFLDRKTTLKFRIQSTTSTPLTTRR
jgi:hypothetical protein